MQPDERSGTGSNHFAGVSLGQLKKKARRPCNPGELIHINNRNTPGLILPPIGSASVSIVYSSSVYLEGNVLPH